MRTPGAILKKLVLALVGLLVAVLAVAGYYYVQITSDVDLSAMERRFLPTEMAAEK